MPSTVLNSGSQSRYTYNALYMMKSALTEVVRYHLRDIVRPVHGVFDELYILLFPGSPT